MFNVIHLFMIIIWSPYVNNSGVEYEQNEMEH